MVPLGALTTIHPDTGPSLITLYNLYPAATVIGLPAPGVSSGQALSLMDQIANAVLPPGTGYDWTAMSYQEKQVGGQIYVVFALAIVLVYLCLAGQYESWITPLAVILSVPLALLGPSLALGVTGLANNLYTQIGIVLLIALVGKERHPDRRSRARASCRGPFHHRRGGRGGAHAIPANPDDLVRVYAGRGATADLAGSGRRGPGIVGPVGVQRHDRLDLPRSAVRAIDVRGDAAAGGMVAAQQAAAGDCAAGIADPRRGGLTRPVAGPRTMRREAGSLQACNQPISGTLSISTKSWIASGHVRRTRRFLNTSVLLQRSDMPTPI